ncbi:MAG TPA: hypothetical protein PLE76_08275 [Rectinema sp.]|jgi:hypothetical protein|nr:hypothetical protein [Rectinema sp.]
MKQNEESIMTKIYAQALANYFNVPQQGLCGKELFDYVITQVLDRKDESSIELLHLLQKSAK